MRSLLVEDEPKTGAWLRKGLTVLLPGQDGWTLLQKLRRIHATPVIFLTARDSVADRVRGLELGADDYLAKPFDFVELVARVRSILRRGQPRETTVLRVGNLELDLTRRKATRQGNTILHGPKLIHTVRGMGYVLEARREGSR
jgi:two-component system, OmpR family, copper resistance phosphate regulon response regulator CusR